MYGIPDSGWGSLTVEIFSYMGVAFVGMNDYPNFCKWHRAYWHLIFIQNGGDMYGWDESTTDKITLIDPNPDKVFNDNTKFWKPSYLKEDGHGQDWVNTALNIYQIHYFDVFKFPPENFYPNLDNNPTEPKTKFWANRFIPYRGNTNEKQIRWTTPSYCMGYSPAWVAGGKTKNVGMDDTKINRPVAEALNPLFTNTAGLYSATDGDVNILQAYILASLQWTKEPDFDATNGFTGAQPFPPPDGTTPFGYDCDVSDFLYNTDIVGVDETTSEDIRKGVKYAATKFPDRWDDIPDNIKQPDNATKSNITDKIGYGITYSYDTATWTQPKINGERCTTWKYIAKSIQRTIISKNGNGWGAAFGNFAPSSGFPSNDPEGARYETLGHDTNASPNTTKLDYIDFRSYQVCETCTKTEP
jgi:hypothetical protein